MTARESMRWAWAKGDRGRALAIVSSIILLLAFAFFYYGVTQHNKTIDLLISKTEQDIDHTVSQIRKRSLRHYEIRLQAFLQANPEIVKAFAQRDHERLYELALPRFSVLQKENSYFRILHFHLPDGHSFLRMHDPDYRGDELMEIRPSVQKIHAENEPISGFEVGRHGGSFRILAPIFWQGRYVGAIEFGLGMHQTVDIMEDMLDLQATTYVAAGEWEKATAYTKYPMVKRGEFFINSHGNPLYERLPSDLDLSRDFHRHVEIDGVYYIIHSHLFFKDFTDSFAGGLLTLQDISQFVENKQSFLYKAILFTICLLILGFTVLHLSFNRVMRTMSREIIRRKEAEQQYREAKTLLECLIDSVPDLIYYKDKSGAYLGCNKAFSDLTGLEHNTIIGHTDAELFQPEIEEFLTAHDQETIESRKSHIHESWQELDHTSCYMHTQKTPYLDQENRLLGVIGISRNLTIHRQATEALEQAGWEWAAAMDADEDAVYILSLKRHLLQANKAFYLMVRTTADNCLGRHIEEIVHPQGELVPCPVCQAQNEIRDAHIVLEAEHPDNPGNVPLEITVTIVRDRHNNPLSIFMRLHDLSEQRAVEDSLRRSKEEWERTFDAMSDLITIQDSDMSIVRANKAAEEFFQVERGGLNGKCCYEVFRGKDTPCKDCPMLPNAKLSGEHPPIVRHENLKKIFHVSSSPLVGTDGKSEYFVHIARDITAQKQLEEELFQAHKMEAIGTLAGGIAHDFNNILGAIIGYSEFVRDDLADDSPSRADIDQVLQAAGRARDLVKQILSFSRKSEHQLQLVEPYYIIREVLKMLHSTLPSSISIEEDLDQHAGLIQADPTKIHQILVNLCTNAFQAMEEEKGVVRVSLQRRELTAETVPKGELFPGPYLVLQVSDTGQGMGQETLERIFDPFFSTKDVGKGTGLGLSVIHGIVKDYKGAIQVESEPGSGSVFEVFFPVVEDPGIISPVAAKTLDKERLGGKEEILVVDDDSLLVRINGRLLSDYGYRVTESTSSQEALEKVRSEPDRFDLLITDQTMPQLTGAELTAEVLKLAPNILVIMCTGHSNVVSKEKALAMGISRYVLKPVQGVELVEVVREVLDE